MSFRPNLVWILLRLVNKRGLIFLFKSIDLLGLIIIKTFNVDSKKVKTFACFAPNQHLDLPEYRLQSRSRFYRHCTGKWRVSMPTQLWLEQRQFSMLSQLQSHFRLGHRPQRPFEMHLQVPCILGWTREKMQFIMFINLIFDRAVRMGRSMRVQRDQQLESFILRVQLAMQPSPSLYRLARWGISMWMHLKIRLEWRPSNL